MAWSRGELLHEGKSKQVWAVLDAQGAPRPDLVWLHYKDDATAFNGVKHAVVADKGAVNAALSRHLTGLVTARSSLRSHLLEPLGPLDHLCRRVEIIPLEVVVRNVVAGSCAKRFGREEGEVLSAPLVEFFYKSDALGDPPVSDVHALAFGWAERWELEFLRMAGLEVNRVLTDFWAGLGITLVDFKIELGRTAEGALVLADEISPDGSRLWERGTLRKLDKDVFRRDLGDLGATYRELYERVFGQPLHAVEA